MSYDGRHVFFSTYSALVPGDTPGDDLYAYDRQTHKAELISDKPFGPETAPTGGIFLYAPSISADSRYVAFSTDSSMLVANDTNNSNDVFVRDRQTKQTKRISVASDGSQTSGGILPKISSDGQVVAFYSSAENLVPGDTNGGPDIFVNELQTGLTSRVSLTSTGTQSASASAFFQLGGISGYGRYVFFTSDASDLVPGDTNGMADAFVHDRQTHHTSLVTGSFNSSQSNYLGLVNAISNDGRYVLIGNNLIDRQTQQSSQVQAMYNGVDMILHSDLIPAGMSMSADAHFIAFKADHPTMQECTPDYMMCWAMAHIYVVDRQTGQTTLASVNSSNDFTNGSNLSPTISADGHYVSFLSQANDLIPGITPGTGVYVRDLLLDTTQQANLAIATTNQPTTLAANATGTYTYNITNTSLTDLSQVNLTHFVSKGMATSLSPSQGNCKRYATTSLCNLGKVKAGGSVTFKTNVKVNANQLRQEIVVSARPIDPQTANNSVKIITPVK